MRGDTAGSAARLALGAAEQVRFAQQLVTEEELGVRGDAPVVDDRARRGSVSGVSNGVGRRYRIDSSAVLPASPSAQLSSCNTQSKKTARKPPCTMPGGPS